VVELAAQVADCEYVLCSRSIRNPGLAFTKACMFLSLHSLLLWFVFSCCFGITAMVVIHRLGFNVLGGTCSLDVGVILSALIERGRQWCSSGRSS
jgi:hypothetical protein